MEESELDYVLVPLGMLVMLLYHGWLLFTILNHPTRIVIGINSQSRHQWVHILMTVLNLIFLSVNFVSFLVFLID
ncbi:hypothetical protein LINPERHAP1_LOCUS3629 [Linum perenne]